MKAELLEEIEAVLGRKVQRTRRLSGGDHAEAWQLITGEHDKIFLKTAAVGSPFKTEALGLRYLRCDGGVQVPEVLAAGSQYLCLEWIHFGPGTQASQIRMGEQLAKTHLQCRAPHYGFDADHFIGATPQKNQPWVAQSPGSWAEFWWTHRLSPMLDRLGDPDLGKSGRLLFDRLADLAPDPEGDASLLHGDLWSGNAGVDDQGNPVMFDPAPYYGHPEADLAMTRMFGGFSPDFYRAYNEVFPLPEGWEDRQDLYMLYHVLNHAVLFGGGYRSQAAQIFRRYV